MNSHRSTKQSILQQLKCLSLRYEELLKNFDETEHSIEKPTERKRSRATFFKKKSEKK